VNLTDAADECRQSSWVYDFDTRLGVPCRWEEYMSRTFPEQCLHVQFPVQFKSRLRIVSGEEYLRYFASDRSHMLSLQVPHHDSGDSGTRYLSPSPPYECICGVSAREMGVANNLMSSFVAMEETEGYGTVYSLEDAIIWGILADFSDWTQ